MKLNHLHLTVSDVESALSFLETYFGLKRIQGEKDNKNFGAMFDDGGLVLTLMKAGRNAEVKYPGHFHIGFAQPSEADVNAIYERLKADGFDIEPPRRAHGWTFYVQAPGGFMVEVVA